MTTDDGPTKFAAKIDNAHHTLTSVPPRPSEHGPRRRRGSKNLQFHAGIGYARSHWGELVQGWLVHDGEIVVGLVTLPDPTYGTTAIATPQRGTGIYTLQADKGKAFRTACLVLEALGVKTGISFRLRSNIPVAIGGGSSTSDCTALVRAIIAAIGPSGKHLSDIELLQIVFAAEGACDPLPLLDWGFPILWASRRGRVLHVYPLPLPELYALGFVSDPERTVSTDTLAAAQAKAPVAQADLDAFAEILENLDLAITTGSALGVARAATASGSLNQKHCPIRDWDRLCKLAESVGALGVSCSHSGTAAAFLWNPSDDNLAAQVAEARAALRQLGATHIHEFRPNG